MRYLILSDIHSNIEALRACLDRAKQSGYDSVLCCGDIVGYGPNPKEAIDIIRDLAAIAIRGNHDRVASSLGTATNFNPHARLAVYWTRAVLPDGYKGFLQKLPIGPLSIAPEAQLVHGAITDEDDYIFTEEDADENFVLTEKHITFFGHSHYQVIFSCDESGTSAIELSRPDIDFTSATLQNDKRFLVNPGAVGQPRDGDPRAGFAIWDQEHSSVELYRVAYPFEITQEKMRRVSLPSYLIERLSYGR